MLPEVLQAFRKPAEPRLRFQRIFEEIRRRICLLDYPPKSVLREQDLAEKLVAWRNGSYRTTPDFRFLRYAF